MDEQPVPAKYNPEALVGGRITIAFGLVFSLLLFSAAISYYNIHQLFVSARELLQSYETQAALGNVLSTMKDVETGARGYIITGDKAFLEPYRIAVAHIEAQTEKLHSLVAQDSRHTADFAALKDKIQARLVIAARCIRVRQENGFEAAQKEVAGGEGKRVMDEIRVLIERMEATGRASLDNRARLDRNKYWVAVIAGIVSTALSLGLLGLTFEVVRRELAARRRYTEILHEQQERFRVTLTSIGDAVIVTDAKGVVTFLNPIAGTLTGWGQEAVGKSLPDVFQIVNEETQQIVESPVAKVLREGTIVGLANHTRLIARAGTEITIDDSGAPIRDWQGNIDGVVLVFRDVSDRRRATRALENSEARYRMLFATAQDAILILDAESGRIVEANPFVCQLLDYSHAELLGKELWQLGLPEQRDAANVAFRNLREQASIRYDNLPLVRKDGKSVDVEFVSNVYEVDRRKVIQCNIRDITQRRQSEEVLRVAGDRYRSVVDHVIHGIITIDENGIVESVNPAAEKLFGYSAAEIVGQNVKLLMPEPFHSEHDGYVANYLRTGMAKIIGIGREVVGLRKDGSTFPVDLAVSTFRLGGRRLFTGIIRDISERKRFEEELRQRAEQLTDADRRKNEFLAMLAHELRNPLAPIHNAVHLLRRKSPTDSEALSAHDIIERQVQHMARMVDDLLDISRITRGKINLHKETIELSAAVERAVEMVQPLIDELNHELTITQPTEAVRLQADLPRLAQVLANLLNNAAKFTENGGHIWLTVEPEGNEVLIKVRDTGVGIAPHDLPHIFDLFSQGDSTLDRTQGGLGIGLTLVKILIQMHGGSIQALSAGTGRGSEFIVRLPTLSVPTLEQEQRATEKREAKQMPRRILVVDDNIDGARSLSILLKYLGHEVQTAHDGIVALETARHWPPDVVLLDIGLPRMNGLEVARRMREELGLTGALLIAMTGYGQQDDRKRSQEAGFNAHLVKPVDLDVLQALLQGTDEEKPARR